MPEYLTSLIEKLSVSGFLDTRASLYMDIVVSFLVLLPFLVAFSIFLAAKGSLRLHQLTQVTLLLLTTSILGFFAYIVHYYEGLGNLLQQSTISRDQALLLLSTHIIIAAITLLSWTLTLFYASSDRRRRALPGVYSTTHKRAGRNIFLGILLTSISAIVVYWMLFSA